MESLLLLDTEKLVSISIIILAMVLITVFAIGFVLKFILKEFKGSTLTTKQFVLEVDKKHSNDSIAIPKKDNFDTSDIIYTNLLGHMYFRDLKRVINVGPQIVCNSPIKAQFIKEFVIIYSKTLLDVLGGEVSRIIDDPNHDLTGILDGSIVERLKAKYYDSVTNRVYDIKYKGTIYSHKGIPSILYTRFDDIYIQMLTILLEQAENIIADDVFHKEWSSKLTGILDILDLSYKKDFCSLTGIIQHINGDLDRYFEEEFLSSLH